MLRRLTRQTRGCPKDPDEFLLEHTLAKRLAEVTTGWRQSKL